MSKQKICVVCKNRFSIRYKYELKRRVCGRACVAGLLKKINHHPNRFFNWKGRVKSADHCRRISLSKIGVPRSPETIEKMRKAAFGKARHMQPHSEATKAKLRAYRGPHTSNWRGGTTALQNLVRGSARFRAWRLAIYRRDGWRCTQCGKKGGWNKSEKHYERLHADHIRPLALLLYEHRISTSLAADRCDNLWDVDNGRTLCAVCHAKTPTYGYGTQRMMKDLATISS